MADVIINKLGGLNGEEAAAKSEAIAAGDKLAKYLVKVWPEGLCVAGYGIVTVETPTGKVTYFAHSCEGDWEPLSESGGQSYFAGPEIPARTFEGMYMFLADVRAGLLDAAVDALGSRIADFAELKACAHGAMGIGMAGSAVATDPGVSYADT